ncbi:hypothetical protein [Paenibacillus sp. FSL L8-0506]
MNAEAPQTLPLTGEVCGFLRSITNLEALEMSCVFCQKEAEMLFNHLTHDMGSLCMEDYMKLHGSCGVCGKSLMPHKVLPDKDYRVSVKFINTGDKNLIVCDQCYDAITKEFAHMFEGY